MPFIGNKPTSVPLTSSDIEDGIITTTKIADANVTNPKLTSGSQQNFRNIIINGDMSIAQRGTSESGITSNGYYTADRMNIINEGIGTFTVSQSTDVPSGQGFAKSMKWDCTTANASPSSGFLGIRQSIEGQNLQYLKKGTANAESTTLSFWIKSNKTGTYIIELHDEDNNRTISQAYTISLASTWEKKTLTFDGDTSGAFGNDNGRSLRVNLLFGAGTEYTSGSLQTAWGSRSNSKRAVGQVNLADSTSNELYITGVQLEAGTTASDFEFLPYDVSLNTCYRYYYKMASSGFRYVGWGQVDNDNNNIVAYIDFKTNMRAAPTAVETTGTAGNYQVREATTTTCDNVPTFNNADLWYAAIAFKKSGITSSNGYAQGEMLKCGTNNGYLAWSAEL